jgi:hypothetical protein
MILTKGQRMEWNIYNLRKEILKGLNEELLYKEDPVQIQQFRENIAKVIEMYIEEPPEIRTKAQRVVKASAFTLLAKIPVITPIITAMLQVITGDDIGAKLDNLAYKMDSLGYKMDKMLSLQEKTLSLQEKTLSLQEKTLSLQEKTISLQEKTLSLQEKTISLQEKTLSLQEKIISLQEKTISILDERLPLSG